MKKASEQIADYVISQSIVKSWISDPYEIAKIEKIENVAVADIINLQQPIFIT